MIIYVYRFLFTYIEILFEECEEIWKIFKYITSCLYKFSDLSAHMRINFSLRHLVEVVTIVCVCQDRYLSYLFFNKLTDLYIVLAALKRVFSNLDSLSIRLFLFTPPTIIVLHSLRSSFNVN